MGNGLDVSEYREQTIRRNRALMNRTAMVIVGIALLALGIFGSIRLADRLEAEARDIWLSKARAEANVSTDAVQSWLNQFFLSLRGAAARFRPEVSIGSPEIAEIAADLENWKLDAFPRSLAFVLRVMRDERADVEREINTPFTMFTAPDQVAPAQYESFAVVVTSNPEGALRFAADLSTHPSTASVVATAFRTPGQVVMGPVFRGADGQLCSLVGIRVRNGGQDGVLVSEIDLRRFFAEILDHRVQPGLGLRLAERETETGETSVVRNLIGDLEPPTGTVATETIRLSNGQAKWNLSWDVMPEFLGGPRAATAESVRMGGIAATIAVVVAIMLMGLQNVRISREVAQKTSELSHERHFLELVLQNISDPIAVADATRRITRVNYAFSRVFGYTPDEIEGQTGAVIYPDQAEYNRVGKTFHGRLDQVEANPFETRCRRKNGEVFTAEMLRTAIVDDDGEVVGSVCMIRDVSARRQHKAELREAKDSAEAGNRAKTEFLANMSHEIRTPLNAIIGFSDILVNQAFGPLGNEKYSEYAADIRYSGDHLLKIVNDILDLSKIEANQYELRFDYADLAKQVDAAVRILGEQIHEAGLTLSVNVAPDLPEMKVDSTAVMRMLINLLSNAMKFTESGGAVTVDACRAAGGELCISVSDTGVGIPEQDIDRVFQPFAQVATAMARDHQGTGLGLAITKWLIEQHGGRIEIESVLGEGTRVVLVFPDTPAAAQDHRPTVS